MGVSISVLAFLGLSDHCPPAFKLPKVFDKDHSTYLGHDSLPPTDEALFDKLYMYPVFASDKRMEQKLKKRRGLFKPVIMHGHHVDKEPRVIDLATVLRNLDSSGDLEKNSTILTSLLIAQFDEGELLIDYAYGFSRATGKSYFYKQGNSSTFLCKVNKDENMNASNMSSKQAFLHYLHQLMNTVSGSVWLNGFCISGPENPEDRLAIESVSVKTIPARVTVSVKGLTGIHCIRTKSRLEIYGRTADEDKTKAIWFRGAFANTLVVTDVECDLMGILVPAYSTFTTAAK